MNIGILTFHSADNYGSVLQAYALRTFVNTIDEVNECDIINFIPPNQEELYDIFLPNNSVKNIVKNARALCFYRLLSNRKAAFKSFREKRLCVYGDTRYTSENELQLEKYDAVITGSDQIWNPRSKDFSMVYYVPTYTGKKVAYAPSFGNGTVKDFNDKNLQVVVGEALKRYQAISVREESGIALVKELSGKTAITVVDPTLLIQETWNELASDCGEGEDYIFFYAIDYNSEAIEMVQKISRQMGLPVKVIFSTNRTYRTIGKGFHWVSATSPEDFLGLVKNAKLVLSSSFHGVAFSVILKKNFYALEANHNGVLYKDQRIHGLLSRLGLEDRIITMKDLAEKKISFDIHYNDKALYEVVEASKRFLTDAIKE